MIHFNQRNHKNNVNIPKLLMSEDTTEDPVEDDMTSLAIGEVKWDSKRYSLETQMINITPFSVGIKQYRVQQINLGCPRGTTCFLLFF